jgi:hypothetical protein
VFDADTTLLAPTEIFVPSAHFATGFVVEAPGCAIRRVGETLLHVIAREPGEQAITIQRVSGDKPQGGNVCAVSCE